MVLTWRNVQEPDFRPAMQGISQGTEMINRALQTAKSGVAEYDKTLTDNTEREHMRRLLAFQDKDALQAALASDPTLGLDPNRVGSQSLATADNRIGALLNRSVTENNEVRAQDMHGINLTEASNRFEDRDARIDAGLAQAELFEAYQSGDANRIEAALEASRNLSQRTLADVVDPQRAVTGLKNDEVSLERNITGLASDKLGIATNQFNLDRAKTEHDWNITDRQERRNASELFMQIGALAGDSNQARALLMDAVGTGKISGEAAYNLTMSLGQYYPNLVGPLQLDLETAGITDPSGGQFGVGGATEGSLNEYYQMMGMAESSGNPNAKNSRSSASGLFQFTDSTFKEYFQKEFGRLPSAIDKNNPAIQRRLVERFTMDNKRALDRAGITSNQSNLYLAHHFGSGGAVALYQNPNASAESVLGKSVIDANPKYRGMTAREVIQSASAHYQKQRNNLRRTPGNTLGQNRTAEAVSSIQQRANANSPAANQARAIENGYTNVGKAGFVPSTIDAMIADNYAGAPKERLTELVDRYSKSYGLPREVVASVLAQNPPNRVNGFTGILSSVRGNRISDTLSVSDRALDALQRAKSPTAVQPLLEQNRLERGAAQITASKTKLDQARARYNALRQRVSTDPRAAQSLRSAQLKLAAAEEAHNRLLDMQANHPENRR